MYMKDQECKGWTLFCGPDSENLVDPSIGYLDNGIVIGFDGRMNSKQFVLSLFTFATCRASEFANGRSWGRCSIRCHPRCACEFQHYSSSLDACNLMLQRSGLQMRFLPQPVTLTKEYCNLNRTACKLANSAALCSMRCPHRWCLLLVSYARLNRIKLTTGDRCRYALIVAAVAAQAGVAVHMFPDVVATPFVAHAVVTLKCAAGVMITASHNPAAYNGYKVYFCNGCQIIPPHDAGIAAEIEGNLSLWDLKEAQPQVPNSESTLFTSAESIVPAFFQYLKVLQHSLSVTRLTTDRVVAFRNEARVTPTIAA
jgi:hypothetical protein